MSFLEWLFPSEAIRPGKPAEAEDLEGQMPLGTSRRQQTLGNISPSAPISPDPERASGGSAPAGVHVVLPHAPPKEALAAVTAGGAIVFACGPVSADGAQGADTQAVGRVEVSTF